MNFISHKFCEDTIPEVVHDTLDVSYGTSHEID